MTTRGLKKDDFIEIANIIDDALNKREDEDTLRLRVKNVIYKCNR